MIADLRAKDLIDERLAQIEKCGPHAQIQRAVHTSHGQTVTCNVDPVDCMIHRAVADPVHTSLARATGSPLRSIHRMSDSFLSADWVKAAFEYFEACYNADDADKCGACYTDKCHVTVNGGAEAGGFGPFTTPSEVAAFLRALRNDLGGTHIKFTVESVEGTNHTDSWVADNGTGTCDADWTKQADGSWKIHRDKISFIPKDPNAPEPTCTKACPKPKPAHDKATAAFVNASIRPSLLDSCRGAESFNQPFTGEHPARIRPQVSRMGVTQVVPSHRELKLYSK